ncbi:hypothetical protein HOK00_08970 [bacterium]|nr:hypothetical protein [bacterium]
MNKIQLKEVFNKAIELEAVKYGFSYTQRTIQHKRELFCIYFFNKNGKEVVNIPLDLLNTPYIQMNIFKSGREWGLSNYLQLIEFKNIYANTTYEDVEEHIYKINQH